MSSRSPPPSSLPKKQKVQLNDDMDLDPDKITVKMPPPRFVSLTIDGNEKTMKNLSPFYIKRALDAMIGKVRNATRLRNGSLLVETLSPKQSETLLKAKLLGSYPIKVERHSSLNTTRGVITTSSLEGLSDEEIQLELAEQSVSKAYRLLGKRDGQTVPLRTIFLTFEVSSLPEFILIGYERVPVRAYVPNPMRCFRCQRFGHTQQRCTNNIVCAKCGEGDHGDSPCPHSVHCVNCNGDHASSSKECPRYIEEKDIQELRVRDNITFFEARKRYYDDQKKKSTTTYASVVHKGLKGCDASTQTPPLDDTRQRVEISTQTYVDAATQTAEPDDDSCGLTIRPYSPKTSVPTTKSTGSTAERKPRRRSPRSDETPRSRSRSGERRSESESPQQRNKQSRQSSSGDKKKRKSPVKPP